MKITCFQIFIPNTIVLQSYKQKWIHFIGSVKTTNTLMFGISTNLKEINYLIINSIFFQFNEDLTGGEYNKVDHKVQHVTCLK